MPQDYRLKTEGGIFGHLGNVQASILTEELQRGFQYGLVAALETINLSDDQTTVLKTVRDYIDKRGLPIRLR